MMYGPYDLVLHVLYQVVFVASYSTMKNRLSFRSITNHALRYDLHKSKSNRVRHGDTIIRRYIGSTALCSAFNQRNEVSFSSNALIAECGILRGSQSIYC